MNEVWIPGVDKGNYKKKKKKKPGERGVERQPSWRLSIIQILH